MELAGQSERAVGTTKIDERHQLFLGSFQRTNTGGVGILRNHQHRIDVHRRFEHSLEPGPQSSVFGNDCGDQRLRLASETSLSDGSCSQT